MSKTTNLPSIQHSPLPPKPQTCNTIAPVFNKCNDY